MVQFQILYRKISDKHSSLFSLSTSEEENSFIAFSPNLLKWTFLAKFDKKNGQNVNSGGLPYKTFYVCN